MTKYLRPALLSLALVTAAAATPALADAGHDRWNDRRAWHYDHAPPVAYRVAILNERQIVWRLHRQGYQRIHDVDLRRGHYTARARDYYGRPVFLVVSAHTGEVLRARHAW